MHTFNETGAGVPAFLAKLWRLVDDPETNNLICWSKDGRSFIIQNQAQFARELLPLNYKHNNMASFIRQLNMYGFHKITSIDNGGLKFDRDEMEFSHPCFKRNCPYLLEHIKRKIANTKSIDEKSAIKPEAVSKVLQDVKAMRGRQDSLDSRFSVMKQENEALWREIASLRQKHAKQQQIVNKLIQFLITIVQPSRKMTSVKRHMQLMINDTPESAKLRKTSESGSDCGPVIHELGEELLDEVADNEFDIIDPNSPYNPSSVKLDQVESPSPSNLERPHSSISMLSQSYDYSNQSVDDVLNTVAVSGLAPAASSPQAVSNGAAASHLPSSIIQSVNPDGSKIVYHVTEVPDTNPTDNPQSVPTNYNEDNVLTTPLVRQQMARSQQLKQKNKQRRKMESVGTASSPIGSPAQATVSINSSDPAYQSAKLKRRNQVAAHAALANEQLHIKSEKELDPMLFLNVYPDNRLISPDAPMISPNLSEDSRPSSVNSGIAGGITATSTTPTSNDAPNDIYNGNEFLDTGIPADIFVDSPLIGGGENSNISNDIKQTAEKQHRIQQQFGQNTASNGKFSSFIAGNNNNTNVASTSAAAAAAASSSGYISNALSPTAGNRATSQGKNGNSMAVKKYKTGINTEDMARDELHGHLDSVQDELDSLKDLLRGDGYSLDANTLLGNGPTSSTLNNRIYLGLPQDGDLCFLNKLFNDSDILGSYGLSFPNENNGEKKGSELMTYQPIYDLSDIIDINNKSELEDSNAIGSSSSSQLPPPPNSVLNTPYHE